MRFNYNELEQKIIVKLNFAIQMEKYNEKGIRYTWLDLGHFLGAFQLNSNMNNNDKISFVFYNNEIILIRKEDIDQLKFDEGKQLFHRETTFPDTWRPILQKYGYSNILNRIKNRRSPHYFLTDKKVPPDTLKLIVVDYAKILNIINEFSVNYSFRVSIKLVNNHLNCINKDVYEILDDSSLTPRNLGNLTDDLEYFANAQEIAGQNSYTLCISAKKQGDNNFNYDDNLVLATIGWLSYNLIILNSTWKLSTRPIGGFNDTEIDSTLNHRQGESCLLLLAVGYI